MTRGLAKIRDRRIISGSWGVEIATHDLNRVHDHAPGHYQKGGKIRKGRTTNKQEDEPSLDEEATVDCEGN